jgi:hypothetical protein
MIHSPVSPVSRKGMKSHMKAINPHFDFIFSLDEAFILDSLELISFVVFNARDSSFTQSSN